MRSVVALHEYLLSNGDIPPETSFKDNFPSFYPNKNEQKWTSHCFIIRPTSQNIKISKFVLSQTIRFIKFIEKDINIYDIKEVNYENIVHLNSNGAHLIPLDLVKLKIINIWQT